MSIAKVRAALEIQLDAMPGIIPSVGIVSSAGGVFKTVSPHLLEAGLHVTVSDHTGSGAVNGSYMVAEVLSETTFTLDDIVSKLDVVSNGTGGSVIANLTAWENMYFPVLANRVPYQKVNLIRAQPENPTFGDGFYREQGILQVTLIYPLQLGVGEAESRAELIRSTFPRGASFSNGGIVVHIDTTPEIMPAHVFDEGYMVPVRIYYYANIFN